MNPLSEESKERLTKYLGECWHDSVYTDHRGNICLKCDQATFLGNQRSFTTWQDLGDCKETLVKKGLGEEFIKFCYNKWVYPDTQVKINPATILAIRSSTGFDLWLFRPTNENGEAHFCQLVDEFLKEKEEESHEQMSRM